MVFGKKKRRIVRVLIVEDEPLVAFDAEHYLTEEGFTVVATTDSVGEAIGHIIAAEKPDIVLVDLGLRDGNGADVAHAACAENIPVLIVSGRDPGEIQAIGLGCLTKPYKQRDLLAAIDICEALGEGKMPKRLPPGLRLFQSAAQ
ncbi:response regulator [Sphingomonas suaedae]|uniref:Response regulator n=1 Tax=Sphingomonas suaedae TaxID=2599297 RepID=A0A518RDD1_9SPHN|nr:response regulator [Sphingomonas suaedae]QDX25485.1 response regulator [Sphingomonas suaedae]